jgi:hypothetical protein
MKTIRYQTTQNEIVDHCISQRQHDSVILTGTPHGVGFVRRPPVFLQPGEIVTIEIDKIGTLILTNPVISLAGSAPKTPFSCSSF